MAVQSKFISGHTHLISLLGNPIGHSASPVTHSISFELAGVDAVYLAFQVDPKDLPYILPAMRLMEGWDGSNVTMPCKQAVIPYLDGLTEAAELIGAVNTIQKTPDKKLIGHNTDGRGFMENFRKHNVPIKGATYTLIGPGGAGSAISVQAVLDGIKKLNIFARHNGPSYQHIKIIIKKLKEKTNCDIRLFAYEDKKALKEAIDESDALINATNVGMGENCTDTPVDPDMIKKGMIVADAIYLPRITQLLQDAKEKGCTIIPGIGMMNEQGALGEQIWYGIDNMPIEKITEEINS